jgi:microcystin-dependent protein
MGQGLHSNNWGTNTNSNMSIIDKAVAGQTIITTTGGTTTLTAAQTNVNNIIISGSLTSNATIVFPPPITGRAITVGNYTNGSYTVTVQASGGVTPIALTQSAFTPIYYDNSATYIATPNTDPTVPVGTIWHYAGAAAPNAQWHLGDGSALSRTTYATLFSVIGGYYGAGDGSTTFNIPDCRGRVLAGPDGGTGRLYSWGLGQAGGESAHTLTITEMPSHHHANYDSGHGHGVSDPGHAHTYYNGYGQSVQFGSSFIVQGYNNSGSSATTSSSTTGIGINTGYATMVNAYAGGGGAHNVVQPTLVTNCIVRVQ